MNTLRKLEADWRADAKNAYANGRYFQMCARDLSSAIPAWEEYIKASEALIHAYDLVAAGNFVREFPQIVERQKRALEGVKAK